MKSVDRDFVGNGYLGTHWFFAYFFVALGANAMLVKIWKCIHLHGLSSYMLFQIVLLSLLFISPLLLVLLFMRYIRSALKENLVSERVAENCEYWIGKLISISYLAFFGFLSDFLSFKEW